MCPSEEHVYWTEEEIAAYRKRNDDWNCSRCLTALLDDGLCPECGNTEDML